MKALKLTRLDQSDWATFGTLTDEENRKLCVTLELPWRNNAHGVSCIPPGQYIARRRFSPKRGYDLFGIEGVPDRSDIEMHIGNLPSDSEGCVLLGTVFGLLGQKAGVLQSGEAFRAFMERMKGINELPITVMDPLTKAA